MSKYRVQVLAAAMNGSCKHCGRAIIGYAHIGDNGFLTKGRCNPDESHLEYGYNAEPEDAPCVPPCIGASR